LTDKIYSRIPVLVDDARGIDGNPWRLSFMAMFHMSNDSGLFRTSPQLQETGFLRERADWFWPTRGNAPNFAENRGVKKTERAGDGYRRSPERYVPLYEAKMIHHFDHRWVTYEGEDSRESTLTEKMDPTFEPTPRYWVPAHDLADRLAAKSWTRGWLLGWRDIAHSAVERTMIAALAPSVACAGEFTLLMPSVDVHLIAGLYASVNTLICDYLVRQKIGGTHLKQFTVKQIPVLPPDFYSSRNLAFIIPRVLELTYTSHSMARFARDIGHEGLPFCWNEERREQLRAELDAWYARAYGLTRDELRYILDPADVKGPDYPSETFRVLKADEIKRFGEYRTARLVLAAWDRMERGELAA
jgi:hypothetical protein